MSVQGRWLRARWQWTPSEWKVFYGSVCRVPSYCDALNGSDHAGPLRCDPVFRSRLVSSIWRAVCVQEGLFRGSEVEDAAQLRLETSPEMHLKHLASIPALIHGGTR